MKHKWKLHPSDYSLGENEKFYSQMEARGWRLEKRGTYWSRFQKVEPSQARYRVEVSAPVFLEGESDSLPEEQLAIYADCGWEYVTSRWMLHIFRAPEGSDAPEFYQDPRQQAETLKGMRRSLLLGWIACAALVLLLLPVVVSFGGGPTGLTAKIRRAWVLSPGIPAFYCLFLLRGIVTFLLDGWKLGRTYRRLKKGIPLDHAPKGHGLVPTVLERGLWVASILCLALQVLQLVTLDRLDMPAVPDGPYIILSDLGWDGQRTDFMGRTSQVEHTRTFLSEYWDTREFVAADGDNYRVTIYQDIYRLSPLVDPVAFAGDLAAESTFADSLDQYRRVEIPGLDAAWIAANNTSEIIAVKGYMAAYVTYPDGRNSDQLIQVLETLADRWSAYP